MAWDLNWRGSLLDKGYENIKRIIASVGGYFGSSYTFEFELVRGKITWEANEDGVFEPALILQMDTESINTFREAMTKCHILTWEQKYIDLHTLDGTQWSLHIEFDDLCIEKSGNNAYPREWERFCKVIQKLTGKPFE
jgi:hypothetical protein